MTQASDILYGEFKSRDYRRARFIEGRTWSKWRGDKSFPGTCTGYAQDGDEQWWTFETRNGELVSDSVERQDSEEEAREYAWGRAKNAQKRGAI